MKLRLFSAIFLTFALLAGVNGANRYKLQSPADKPGATTDFQYKPDLDPEVRKRQAENCEGTVPQEILDEIESKRAIAEAIMYEIVNGSLKGVAYQELHDLVDKFPIRLSGFQNLEDSIDYMIGRMQVHGLENVRGEQVLVPHWVRGEEKATLIAPWGKNLPLLGLGTTVGTPVQGIEAEVLVVTGFDDLAAKADLARGKIVVYNQGWLGSYGTTNQYRTQGASRASQFGAVATLIQSVAPFSLDTPHTGGQSYWQNVSHIPTACITMEDADLLYRLQEKGERIVIHLKMLDYNLPLTTSRNVIGEIPGSTLPTEYVGLSGHIDSWDVGQGAMDDAGGCMISMVALAAMKKLNLAPKRTMQTILWTSEEPGLWGVKDFAAQHADILDNYSAVFESDSGTFAPVGLDFAGTVEDGCIVYEILKLAESIGATMYQRFDLVSSDITELTIRGVPGLSLNNANDMYFWYHHTEADTITMQDPEEMDKDAALFAMASYIIGDLNKKFDRAPPPTR